MMRRRVFVVSVGAFAIAPLLTEAQPAGKIRHVGVLAPGAPPLPHFDAFRQGLRDLGYVEGRNLVLETRWEEGKPDRYPAFVADLIHRKVDIIVVGTTPSALAAKKATKTVPIVMAAISDPVGSGLVESLARPGGNVTGLSLIAPELSGKRIEILKESVPGLTRVAVVSNPENPISPALLQATQAASRALSVKLQPFEARKAADLDRIFPAVAKSGAEAMLLLQDAMFTIERIRIADLARKHRLPTISGETGFAAAGGLMNFGPNIAHSWRQAALYVDRILRGAKPVDLPIAQPTKFELVINLKTAKALGLTIPQSILVRADEIIQ